MLLLSLGLAAAGLGCFVWTPPFGVELGNDGLSYGRMEQTLQAELAVGASAVPELPAPRLALAPLATLDPREPELSTHVQAVRGCASRLVLGGLASSWRMLDGSLLEPCGPRDFRCQLRAILAAPLEERELLLVARRYTDKEGWSPRGSGAAGPGIGKRFVVSGGALIEPTAPALLAFAEGRVPEQPAIEAYLGSPTERAERESERVRRAARAMCDALVSQLSERRREPPQPPPGTSGSGELEIEPIPRE